MGSESMDMYTRVKRVRQKVKRDMYGMPLVEEEEEKTTEDEETENDEEGEDGEVSPCGNPFRHGQ